MSELPKTLFGVPVVVVPELDHDTTDPVYRMPVGWDTAPPLTRAQIVLVVVLFVLGLAMSPLIILAVLTGRRHVG